MNTFRIKAKARKLGAIGKTYRIDLIAQADNTEAALLKVYEEWQDVFLPVITNARSRYRWRLNGKVIDVYRSVTDRRYFTSGDIGNNCFQSFGRLVEFTELKTGVEYPF